MRLNTLFNLPGAKRSSKRVGRGVATGKGKTCGRGAKGQKSRAGVSINGFEGGQTSLIKRLPKRGFSVINRNKYYIINISQIINLIQTKKIENNAVIDHALLSRFNIIPKANCKIKLLSKDINNLGNVDLTNLNLKVNFDKYSLSAKENIIKLGIKLID